MSPTTSWLLILVLFVGIPMLVAHIAVLLDERNGWMKRHERWMAEGTRPDVRFDATEIERPKLKSEREGETRGWREARP